MCRWWSFNTTKDFLCKLYLPPKVGNRCTLFDILQFNSEVPSLSSVFCGRCDRKTDHSAKWEHNAGILILEIVRATERRMNNGISWKKNCVPISFPVSGIQIPGSGGTYRVISTCHHRGSIRHGHWLTKIRTQNNIWYEIDDLKHSHSVTSAPGTNDTDVVLLMLVSEIW
jgi:ubiquitin C-terminal hydrolase